MHRGCYAGRQPLDSARSRTVCCLAEFAQGQDRSDDERMGEKLKFKSSRRIQWEFPSKSGNVKKVKGTILSYFRRVKKFLDEKTKGPFFIPPHEIFF